MKSPTDCEVVKEPLTGGGVSGTHINRSARHAAFGEACPACKNTTMMLIEHCLVQDGSLAFAAASSGALCQREGPRGRVQVFF